MTNVSPLFPPGHPRHIPEAWPSLMSEDQVCAYVGGICRETLAKVCPVAPVDLGANVKRWRKTEIDLWVAGLRPRGEGLRESGAGPKDGDAAPVEAANSCEDAALAALDRVRQRAEKGGKWKRTA